MKIFITFFAVFTLASTYVNAYEWKNYTALANNLLSEIKTLLVKVDNVNEKVELMRHNLNKSGDSLDFGIPRNPQIIELQNTLKSYEFHKGIDACIKIKNDYIETVEESLRVLVIDSVNKQLDYNQLELSNARQRIAQINEYLQGVHLLAEVKLCELSPDVCNITIAYPKELKSDESKIDYTETVTDSILNLVIKTTVNPILPGKINEICGAVNDCINHLRV